jgi:hypothetical protein
VLVQVKDHFLCIVWLYPLKVKKSKYVVECFYLWLALNGSPRAIYCDNGTEFQGGFDDLYNNRYPVIPCIRGHAYYPKTQGSIEAANKAFKRKLRALRRERGGGG